MSASRVPARSPVQVSKLLNPLQEEVSCKKVDIGMVLDIAHLIDSDGVEKYQSRYSSALRQFKDVEISLTRALASLSLHARAGQGSHGSSITEQFLQSCRTGWLHAGLFCVRLIW